MSVPGLEIVRVARGFTQAELAAATGLPQSAISKCESGEPLDEGRLEEVARVLECPTELLTDEVLTFSASACVFHRKRASTTVAQAKQARAWLALARLHSEKLLDLVDAPKVRLPRVTPTDDEYVTPEDVAGDVRSALRLPLGPVPDLVGALEDAGVIVRDRTFDGRKIDALSDWLAGHRPVFLLNSAVSGERQRFTLAHETGHAVMHEVVTEKSESQADRFAAELLMPAEAIRSDLENPTLERLLGLKRKWQVSAAALARRAFDLGLVSDAVYRRLNMEMSAAGWRSNEPLRLPRERPELLAATVARAKDHLGVAETARRVYLLDDQLSVMFEAGDAHV